MKLSSFVWLKILMINLTVNLFNADGTEVVRNFKCMEISQQQSSPPSTFEDSIAIGLEELVIPATSHTSLEATTSPTTHNIVDTTEETVKSSTMTTRPTVSFTDCQDVYEAGNTINGIYQIRPLNWTGPPFDVYCKMAVDKGWTVFQRRVDATIDFVQDWVSYKNGFGNLNENFWLGNEKIHFITNQRTYKLRFDITTSNGISQHAEYSEFRIDSESNKYRLAKLGTHDSGNAGDNFSWNEGKYFSTYDRDNDGCSSFNCADRHKSGWWHSRQGCNTCWLVYCSCFQQSGCCFSCTDENLNGEYNGANGQNIYSSDNTFCNILYVEMKLLPTS